MEFKAFKDDLISGCQMVQNVISAGVSLPILSNMLIEAKKDKVYLTGTDLDIGISTSLAAKVEKEGAVTVPAKRFSNIIRELAGEDIEIKGNKNHSVNIESGNSHFKLMGIPRDEFPKLPDFKDREFITLSQGLFRRMLQMSAFAISKDETRYVLNGACLQIKEEYMRMVTTDGRRLVLIEKKQGFPAGLEKKIIIPSKTIQELIRNLSRETDLKIVFGENQACFEFDETIITSRLIEGSFPDYEQVIPKELKEKIKVDKSLFYHAIKRVSLYTNPESSGIKIDVANDKIILSKSAPEIGEAKDQIPVEYSGQPLSIGFNPNYLLDVLKVLGGEEIELELAGPQKPGVIRQSKPHKYIYVVLPMQLT
jgi:DNA polymerase III subunit beta